MLKAKIIRPEEVEGQMSCDDCKIEYPRADYETLFGSKKIIYFDLTLPDVSYIVCLCHDCLFKYVKRTSGGKKTELVLFDQVNEYHLKFDPDDFKRNDK